MNPLIAKYWKPATVVVVVVIGALWISKCQGDSWTEERDALLDSNDSLRAVVIEREAQSAAHEQRARIAEQERQAAQDSAKAAHTEANRLRAARAVIRPVASRPGTAPTTSDTLAAVLAALTNAEAETDALRAVIRQDSTAMAAANRSQAEMAGALALERKSVADLMAGNAGLANKLASASPPCRVLFFNCPTRKTVFTGGAVIGTAITYLIVRN